MGYDEPTYKRFFNEARRLHPTYTDAQLKEWAVYSATYYWNRLHPEVPPEPGRWKRLSSFVAEIPWSKVAIVLYRLAVLGLLCRLTLK